MPWKCPKNCHEESPEDFRARFFDLPKKSTQLLFAAYLRFHQVEIARAVGGGGLLEVRGLLGGLAWTAAEMGPTGITRTA